MRIAIIDDHEPVSTSFANVFRARGDQTNCFASGEEFFGSQAHRESDCILVDFQLPGMNGCEIIRILREKANQTPAILLTGNVDDDLIRSITKYSLVKVLRKPSTVSELYASIDELCADDLPDIS